MSWRINGEIYTGRIVEVGTGKEFTDFSAIQTTYPNQDLLILTYAGTYAVHEGWVTPDAYNKYIKAMETGVIFGYQMLYGAFDNIAVKDFIVEGVTLTGSIDGARYGYQKFVYSKCNINPPYRGFTILGTNGTLTARYCTIINSKPIAECQLGGTGEGVSIHRCVGSSIGAGDWDESDYKTAEEEDYGWNYGEDYIQQILVDVATLPASNITQSNFVANGSIDNIGSGVTIVKRGFCYKVKE